MSVDLEIKKFLQLRDCIPIIDVRSPMEYKSGHIIGSENLYLFDDDERAEVGTIYKQIGKDKAIEKGLEIVGSRMSGIVKKAKKISPEKKIGVYCARGGMRSESIAWLLSISGFEVFRLIGGYKSYRNYLEFTVSNMGQNVKLISGATGSGKTEILKILKSKGEQIIDLEGIASHKGSAFGALGLLPQPTTETFMNILYEELLTMDSSRTIWVENESKMIGSVFIPDAFFSIMKNASILSIDVPMESRINRILEQYGCFDKEQLKISMNKISKRLGGDNLKNAIDAIDDGNLYDAVKIALTYYDKAYRMATEKNKNGETYTMKITSENIYDIADKIIEWDKTQNK